MAEHYRISAVTAATDATSGDIRNWETRGFLRAGLEPSGRGKVRNYTLENVMEFAILKEWSKRGLPIRDATFVVNHYLDRMTGRLGDGEFSNYVTVRGDGPMVVATRARALADLDEDFIFSGDPTAIIMNLSLLRDRTLQRLEAAVAADQK